MALVKIRGEQIQQEVLTNAHIAAGAAIAESKLAVNWAQHYSEALATKVLLDYVQKNGVAVAAAANSVDSPVDAANPHVNDNSTDLGIVVTNTDLKDKNKVLVRDSATGEPINDGAGGEVFGRMTWSVDKFVLSFYKANGDAFTFAAADTVDIQYIQRFNLRDVDEKFTMNEKYVDGAADVTAHLNIEQLANDIYGEPTLDRDGQPNGVGVKGTSIKDQLNNLYVTGDGTKGAKLVGVQTSGVSSTNVADALGEINSISMAGITSCTNAINTTKADLASNAAGKGASLVGVEDAAGKFTATTVEGVLGEVQGNVAAEVTARTNADSTLQGNIDAEATARAAADTAITTNLASDAAGKGASLVGVQDVGNKFTAGTVEGVLAELQGNIEAVANSGGSGLDTLKADLANTADAAKGANLIGVYDAGNKITSTNVNGALIELADLITTDAGNLASYEALLASAGGAAQVGIEDTGAYFTGATAEAALQEIGAKNAAQDGRLTTLEGRDHTHVKAVVEVTEAMVATGEVPIGAAFDSAATLDVFVNGILQVETTHYTPDAVNKNKVTFGAAVLVAGDLVVFKYLNNSL